MDAAEKFLLIVFIIAVIIWTIAFWMIIARASRRREDAFIRSLMKHKNGEKH